MNLTTKNLFFLFGAAPMGMTGCLGSADDSDTLITLTTAPFTTDNNEGETTGDGDSTTGDGDGDPTTAGDGDGDPTTGDGDGDGDGEPGDGDGDPTTGDGDGDPTTGDGDGDTTGDGDGDTTGDGDGDTGGGVEEVCGPYSALVGECYGMGALETAYDICVTYYNMFQGNPACLDAFEAFLVCISQLTCDEFAEGLSCEQELQQYSLTCS